MKNALYTKVVTWLARDVIEQYKAAAALVISGYASALAAAGTDSKKRNELAAAKVAAAELQMATAMTEQKAAREFAAAYALLAPASEEK